MQARQVLRDAVQGLAGSFSNMHAMSETQKSLLLQTMDQAASGESGSGQEQGGVRELYKETSEILQFFIDLLVDISRQR